MSSPEAPAIYEKRLTWSRNLVFGNQSGFQRDGVQTRQEWEKSFRRDGLGRPYSRRPKKVPVVGDGHETRRRQRWTIVDWTNLGHTLFR